ncbi:cell morphogenesis N-terminal-domain-containing protein [Mycena floridula]|nr:cell morphogenesis N-terminal-domain-containing protein [Mycena floridula]
MSEGIQITIPDFDDDDYPSSTTPFGRSGGQGFGFGASGFGGGGFGGGSGSDSPVATPLAERGERAFFTSHGRGDSVTSIDSANSITTKYSNNKSITSFGYSSQSSIATPVSAGAFAKKTSFASIRNAFKSTKNSETPPVPQLDFQLKSPFSRSTSSLTSTTPLTSRGPAPPSASITSPAFGRPNLERRPTKGSRGHIPAKSYHSQTGSTSSDVYSHPFSASPPPVPRFPNGNRSETPDFDEDKVVMDPKTPSDYALHAIFIRFATSAEGKIDVFLRHMLDVDPQLADFMGQGVDPKFDEILDSLGQIAQKHAKPVVDSIMRWRRSQLENVGSDIIRYHMGQSPGPNRTVRPPDVPGLLNERKSLASIYIMCRALIAVLRTLGKDALGEKVGHALEKTTFEQFKKPDLKLLLQSSNHRTNADLYATLLGYLANVRFLSVTDRFLAELEPVAHGQVPKDLDMKYENLVKGIRHIQIKVWPPEAFEEGAEFLESLSKSFANAHGFRLKSAFAETLVHLLHPIGKTAQAETNNPLWAKAIELIYPKAREMMAKPRYWSVAFPLVITSLCVSPDSLFRKHWVSCFEASLAKLKEKSLRIPIMNGLMRLIWTYLYRCQESASSTSTKIETLFKNFFPMNRLSIFPNDENLEPFIYMTHFVLSRHFELGRDICLELMQEGPVKSAHQSGGNILATIAPERTAVAVQAILLSLAIVEREGGPPTWPSSSDFSLVASREDYISSSEFVPSTFMTKPGMQEFFDRCGTTLALVAVACSNAVGSMSMFDEQWSQARTTLPYDEPHNFVVKNHPEAGTIAYPLQFTPQISILQTCFQSWPRCLHPSLPVADAIDMLLHGIIHVEPLVGKLACLSLKRFMADTSHSMTVLSRFNLFLFNPFSSSTDGTGVKLLVESRQLLDLWATVVDGWVQSLLTRTVESLAEDEDIITSRCSEIEAGALFLLSHDARPIHLVGVKIIRILGQYVTHITPDSWSPSDGHVTNMRSVEQMHGSASGESYLYGFDELLDQPELSRLEQWRQSKRNDIPLRIADSSNEKDRKLWHYVFPVFMQSCMDNLGQTLATLRDILVAAASRYHPTISHLAGLSTRLPAGRAPLNSEKDGSKWVMDNRVLIDQWHFWIKILSSIATLPDLSRPAFTQLGREHNRAPSDTSFERERLTTTRGLFRYLTPFLDSEYTLFRDAAVLCISSFPSSAYPHLLEDLSLLAGRQFYDDQRSKAGASALFVEQGARQGHEDARTKALLSVAEERTRRQERLHSAVARIYYLTAHLLQQQRSIGRQTALTNVLKFVRNTQAFLTSSEMRDNYTLQRLRRYFCGTVERLFDGLSSLMDSDRFIPSHMHLTLYRLCEEWCLLGPQSEIVKQRLTLMERAAASGTPQVEASEAIDRFREETRMLSFASVGALASLCQKAFSPPPVSSGSPTERSAPEYMKPLSSVVVLERLNAILSSSHEATQRRGKKALKSLLLHNVSDINLIDESLRRAVVLPTTSSPSPSNNALFFEVISEIVCTSETHGFSFCQVVALALSNLCHPLLSTRRQAFDMLETIHHQFEGMLSMSQFEATIGSLAPGTYVHAHRVVADFLAGEHPLQAPRILAQLASWLPQFPETAASNALILLLLQSLEFWLPNIQLMTEDRTGLSQEGLSALFHLVTLSRRYGQTHTEQIMVLWTRLIDPPNQSNGHATVRFLLEQSHKVGSTVFINCAANIVACLCQTTIGPEIFEDLCTVIEPARMLPTIEHKLAFPDARDMELWSDLDALFSDEQPRLSLGSAQFAWLFLADVTLQRYWEFKVQLPLLLHSVFTHLDHRSPFVRRRAKRMLFLLLRSWAPGYDELTDRAIYRSRATVKQVISSLEEEAEDMYWSEEDKSPETNMKWLCGQVISLLEPLCPSLRDRWGSLALTWGTSCSIRAIAFRSLQIFRSLAPNVKKNDLALLLGRLSNTISTTDSNIQYFTVEIILTVQSLAASNDLHATVLPQMFWSAVAALATTVENEFIQVLKLLDVLLPRINFDDPSTKESLDSQRPLDWIGLASLQPALLNGLRSAATSSLTFKILQTVTKFVDSTVIDASDGRVRDLYTLALPWCLHAMSADNTPDDNLREFAENVGILAKQEGRHSIHKIMTSFAKSHFRTRDDFLRQSVASLREHYGVDHWTEIVTLLMGLVLNRERWLRIQTMQILKVLFQQRETRNPVELLGSELLMPLLRLLETDLASQALEVLEEPMAMSGGLAAKHVLRMSMHSRIRPVGKDIDSAATVFGVPEESGWCVVQADDLRKTCRANVMAVFDTCAISSRPSQIVFEPEADALAEPPKSGGTMTDDLGGLVQNLHDLTSFFQDTKVQSPSAVSLPSRRLEARVAAILAKSTASDAVMEMDVPQTPFVDVFRVGSMPLSDDDESDEDSNSDSEMDAFIFDSPVVPFRAASNINGSRLH